MVGNLTADVFLLEILVAMALGVGSVVLIYRSDTPLFISSSLIYSLYPTIPLHHPLVTPMDSPRLMSQPLALPHKTVVLALSVKQPRSQSEISCRFSLTFVQHVVYLMKSFFRYISFSVLFRYELNLNTVVIAYLSITCSRMLVPPLRYLLCHLALTNQKSYGSTAPYTVALSTSL